MHLWIPVLLCGTLLSCVDPELPALSAAEQQRATEVNYELKLRCGRDGGPACIGGFLIQEDGSVLRLGSTFLNDRFTAGLFALTRDQPSEEVLRTLANTTDVVIYGDSNWNETAVAHARQYVLTLDTGS